jgi:putative flippase GtrA
MMPVPPSRIDRRFFGFLLAGCVNTLFGYAVYGGLVLAGVMPHMALGLGAIAGILFNFFSTGLVFASHDRRRLPRFLAVYGVFFLANVWLLDFLMHAGIGPLIAQAGAVLLFTPLTFLAMRRFVFPRRPEATP